MIKTFFIKCQYETATGTEKNKLHKKLEANVMKTIRAKLFEGCLEATFQVHYHITYYRSNLIDIYVRVGKTGSLGPWRRVSHM